MHAPPTAPLPAALASPGKPVIWMEESCSGPFDTGSVRGWMFTF